MFLFIRNGRYIFFYPLLLFISKHICIFSKAEETVRAAATSSCRIFCHLLLCFADFVPSSAPSCPCLPLRLAHCPLLPEPRLGSGFVPAVISGDFAWYALVFAILCGKKIIRENIFILWKTTGRGKKSLPANIQLLATTPQVLQSFLVVPFSLCYPIRTL